MAPYQKTEARFEHDSPAATLRSVVDVRVSPLFLETALLAIFTVQTLYFYQQCATARETDLTPAMRRRPYINSLLCLSICMYLLVLAYWILDIIILRQELMVFLPKQLSSRPSSDIYHDLTDMLGVHWYVQAILQVLIWTASDIVALWRAYVVLGRARWLRVTTLILLSVEIGVYFVKSVCYLYVLPNPPRFIRLLDANSRRIIIQVPYLTAASTTVAVQIFTTALIAYKALIVWKGRKGLFGGPGRVFRVLAVLIETGVAYTLLWIWYFIATNDAIFSWKVTAWTDYYLMPITAMYPTLVVMIVTMQDSVLDQVERSQEVQCSNVRLDGIKMRKRYINIPNKRDHSQDIVFARRES